MKLTPEEIDARPWLWKKGAAPPIPRSNDGKFRARVADLSREIRDILHEPHPTQRNKTRLRVILDDLMESRPELVLAYAYGRPKETVEMRAMGVNIDFDLPQLSPEELRDLLEAIRAAKKSLPTPTDVLAYENTNDTNDTT